MMDIWVVIGQQGEYSDHSSWVQAIFSTKEAADQYAAEINAREKTDSYMENTYDVEQHWLAKSPAEADASYAVACARFNVLSYEKYIDSKQGSFPDVEQKNLDGARAALARALEQMNQILAKE